MESAETAEKVASRRRKWVAVLGWVAVAAFSVWAVRMVGASAALRDDLRRVVALRGQIDDAVHDLQTHHPGEPAVARALTDLEVVGRGAEVVLKPGASEPLRKNVEALRSALQGGQGGEGPTQARQAVFESARELKGDLRAVEGALSGRLESSWQALEGLAFAAIVLAASVLLLVLAEQRQGRRRQELDQRLAAALSEAEVARAEAQRASGAKSEFLATVSHEIRTPLTSVLGTIELLAGTTLTASQREYLAVIGSGSEAVLRLVSDVLDLARIEAGRLELHPRPTDVHSFCDGLALLFAGPAEGRGLNLSVVVGGNVPASIEVDEDRLRQILVNVLGNALKFTVAGEVSLRVTREGGTLHFTVRDTGPGVPAEVRERLFAPFEQGVPARTQLGGSGLGLAIARRLAEGLGGSITLEPGDGAVFTLAIPMLDGPPPPGMAPCRVRVLGDDPLVLAATAQLVEWGAIIAANGEDHDLVLVGRDARPNRLDRPALRLLPLAAADADPHALRGPVRPVALRAALTGRPWEEPPATPTVTGRRVLVVDDQPSNRRVLGELLQRLGHVVDTAQGGVEGVERARGERFDVVLMDLDMPDLDGIGATLALREDGGASSRAAIIGLSGHATEEARTAGLEAGMDDWIGKPVRLRDLARAVDLAARRREG